MACVASSIEVQMGIPLLPELPGHTDLLEREYREDLLSEDGEEAESHPTFASDFAFSA
jgi:hypothetical protein